MRTVVGCALVACAVALSSVDAGGAPTRPCAAKDLRGRGQLQGATGSMLGSIHFRNTSSSACVLGGRPRVALYTRAGRLLRTREERLTVSGFRPIVLLRPGRRASLYLQWRDWCASWPRGGPAQLRFVVRLRLTTGRRATATLFSELPRCDVHTGSTLGVSSFGV
jgi:uncharacterized protein DUF4232